MVIVYKSLFISNVIFWYLPWDILNNMNHDTFSGTFGPDSLKENNT